MAKIIDVSFWTLLEQLNNAVESKNIQACLDFLEMIEWISNDRVFLDRIGILHEFRIVQVIDSAGAEGLRVWRKVVSEECWKLEYHYFLATEVRKVRPNTSFTHFSIKLKDKEWVNFEYSYDIQEDLRTICSM